MREVFTAGGGGGGNPTSISPGSRTTASNSFFKSGAFAAISSAAAPTSYAWGLLDGDGAVTAGGATANATLQVYADPGNTTSSVFFCDMVVSGVTYRATCTFTHTNTGSGGGGGGGGVIP